MAVVADDEVVRARDACAASSRTARSTASSPPGARLIGRCSFHEDRDLRMSSQPRTAQHKLTSGALSHQPSTRLPRAPTPSHRSSAWQVTIAGRLAVEFIHQPRLELDLRKAWRCLPASPGPSSAACGRLARALLRCGMHLHCCLFAREKRDLERSQGRMLALSAHARSCISLYPVCVSDEGCTVFAVRQRR